MAVLSVSAFSLLLILIQPSFQSLHSALLSVPISVFSVSMVCLVVAFVMYRGSKKLFIKVLKRRAGRVYGELLQHKMKIIDAMDGQRKFVDIEKYIYNNSDFQHVRKFMYEEYFLLLEFEPFLYRTHSAEAVEAFYSLHKDLETFMRSISYDKIEFDKFRVLYQQVFDRPLVGDTPEGDYQHPKLIEAHDAILFGLEYALSNTDNLLSAVDSNLIKLNTYFPIGLSWEITKQTFDNDFHLWLHAKS